MTKTTFLFTFVTLLFIISCKKDNKSSGSSLQGDWKFISIQAQTQSTDQYSDGGSVYKTITNSAYTSTNNGGTISISATNMAGNGITYKVTDTAYAYDYTDNQLTDSFSTIFNVTIPPVNSTSAYQLVSQDSLNFSGQGPFTAPGGSGTTTTTGAKFMISGNMLTLTSSIIKDTTIDSGGTPVTQHETASVVATLQRQ